MMKNVMFLTLIVLISAMFGQADAQINWTEHDIDTDLNGAWGLDVIDMNVSKKVLRLIYLIGQLPFAVYDIVVTAAV